MKFKIKHEIEGRIRIEALKKNMSMEDADIMQYYFECSSYVTSIKIRERSRSVVICYNGSRKKIIELLTGFQFEKENVPNTYMSNSGRKLDRMYYDKLSILLLKRLAFNVFCPIRCRRIITLLKSVKYIKAGIKTLAGRKIEVPVLDAAAISVSMLRGDFKTAGSIMFLLGLGEILEEWTHKKSVDDLARNMSLNTGKVWLMNKGNEELVSCADIQKDDIIKVYMGTVIPFDGIVINGEAMVNQASLTGESTAVRRASDSSVYAGTIVEEGELCIQVKECSGGSRFEKIVEMIEETEKLKSSMESKAEHLADKLVPYTLIGTFVIWLLTRNVTKALAMLLVDFSCALKLAIPISVLSAMKEASKHNITVKGGKYMEAVATAETVVFDKTGTLTKALPVVADVVSFDGRSSDELLRIAACLEEHFPHSMAKAVVDAAKKKNLEHEELHSEVKYIVAHGISSAIDGHRVVIGSHHFVFDDEMCVIPSGSEEKFDNLPAEYTHLYMAIEGSLAAVICINDPIREEAAEVIRALKSCGIKKTVMMTGDSEKAAAAIARIASVDEYYSEVLPEDKAAFIEKEKASGRKVIMIGDGINDSPALSAADVGIAISDGAELAREIADIIISSDDLMKLTELRELSVRLMNRISKNYRSIVGINGMLIFLGVGGFIMPTTSAFLHNISTLAISLRSMRPLLTVSEIKDRKEKTIQQIVE